MGRLEFKVRRVQGFGVGFGVPLFRVWRITALALSGLELQDGSQGIIVVVGFGGRGLLYCFNL